MFQLIIITLPIIILLNFSLGMIIISRDFKNKTNLWFAGLVFSIALWSFGVLGFYSVKPPAFMPSVWIMLTHFSAALLPLIFLYFSFIFPKKILSTKYPYFLLFIPFAIISYLIFFTKSIIGDVNNFKYEINQGYIFYGLYIISYFFIGYVLLYFQYKKAESAEQKIQIKYVLAGAFISSTLALITDLVFPYLGIFEYTWLGPLFTSILAISITYAILKHHLFDIKVVTTEIFALAIWIILLIKIFLSLNYQDAILNVVIFLAVLVFGILLIQSALREVKEKEKIRKAYEVEKRAHEELKKTDEAKSQFMVLANHHLRTPLTAIKWYLEPVLSGKYGKLAKKQKDALEKVETSTKEEIKIVDELLDISRYQLGTGELLAKPDVDLEKIMAEIIEMLRPEAEQKNIALELQTQGQTPRVSADESKLKMAVSNIISNSLKYTEKGSVKINLSRPDEKHILISVKDTGIGLEPEEKQKLFKELFYRGSEAEKLFAIGKGIGLFLAGKVVALHRGKIWAESEGRGKGSEFFIELPA